MLKLLRERLTRTYRWEADRAWARLEDADNRAIEAETVVAQLRRDLAQARAHACPCLNHTPTPGGEPDE